MYTIHILYTYLCFSSEKDPPFIVNDDITHHKTHSRFTQRASMAIDINSLDSGHNSEEDSILLSADITPLTMKDNPSQEMLDLKIFQPSPINQKDVILHSTAKNHGM